MAETHAYASQVEFADGQPQEGSPETLFRLRPTRSFELDFFSDRIRFRTAPSTRSGASRTTGPDGGCRRRSSG